MSRDTRSCVECSKGYRYPTNLSKHLVKVHGYVWFDNLGVVPRSFVEESEPDFFRSATQVIATESTDDLEASDVSNPAKPKKEKS